MGFEGGDDVLGAYGDVVVAEAGEALGSFEVLEDLGGDAGRAPGDAFGGGAAGDEVAGEEDEVRIEAVHDSDGMLEEPGLGELLEVDVGDLDDVEVDEGVGQVADGDGAVSDFELVAAVGSGVADEAKPGGRGADEKAAPGDGVEATVLFAGGTVRHRS